MTSIRKSLFWSLCERHLSQIITLISSMILARLLTPKEIGIFSLCAAFLAIASIFRDFGVSEYIIQEKELTKEKLSGAFALTAISAWSMALLLFLARSAIADFYNEPALIDILTILCINFLVLPIASPAFAVLNREMAFQSIFFIQLSTTTVHAIVAVGLAMHGFSYMSLAWASLLSIVAQTLIITFFRPKYSMILPNPRYISHVWKFGLMFSSSRTIEVVMSNSHEFIIGRQFGFEALGLFSRALGLINLFWQNVTSAIARVAAPAFASTHRDSMEELQFLYKKSVSIFTVIAWPFFCFAIFESEGIILLLFGDQWLAAAPITSIMATGTLIGSVCALAPNVLIATGQVKRRLHISLMVAPVHIVGITIASFFNLWAIAAVWIFGSVFALILYNYHLSKAIGFSYRQIVNSAKESSLVTLVCATTLIAAQILKATSLNPLIILPIQAALFSLIWLVAVYIFKHPIRSEIDGLLEQLKSKMAKKA